ncbi:GEVED domain-containing protein [Planctomycetota bacterium]
MRAKKLLIWTWVALVLLMFTGNTRAVDSFFDISTVVDWEEALYGGSIKPVTSDLWDEYMMDWEMFCEEGDPYPVNEFRQSDLYVMEASEPEFPEAGLVMAWGEADMAAGDYSSAWEYVYPEDPDLSNATITITVTAPQLDPLNPLNQINVVSFGIVDGNGLIRAWYWNVGQPGDPIQWGVPTTITINAAMTGVIATTPTASAYMNTPGFNIVNAQSFIVDENATWVGGGTAVPPPGQTIQRPWNYWDNLSVKPNPVNYITVGFNEDIHQDILDPCLPNDFHIEGFIISGDPCDVPGGGGWLYPPILASQINDLFPYFKYQIIPDPTYPGENGFRFTADWWLDPGQYIPHCTVLHLGLEFKVVCHNVIIELEAWWTRDGQPIVPPPTGPPIVNAGNLPIVGFDVQDQITTPPGNPTVQSVRIQNAGHTGPRAAADIEIEIVAMDLVSVAPIHVEEYMGEDPLAQLRLGGMQDFLPWVQVHQGSEPISESNPIVMQPDSFFDVFFDISFEIHPDPAQPPVVIPPGGHLFVRELMKFTDNSGEVDFRWIWHWHEAHAFDSDLGDAPDRTNSHGINMTAYPWGAVPANFPTVYLAGSPAFGPIHWFPKQVAHLGQNVTWENEADIPPDQDGPTNIWPPLNAANRDQADDGVLNLPLWMPHCMYRRFQYQVNIINAPAGTTLYFNAWADFDRDGDWDDSFTCPAGPAPEWIVQDQDVTAVLGGAPVLPGLYNITTPQFLSYHVPGTVPSRPLWLRATLSETPWSGTVDPISGALSGGSGPAGGYSYGETEDYYFRPKTDCPDTNNDGEINIVDWAYWASWWLLRCNR